MRRALGPGPWPPAPQSPAIAPSPRAPTRQFQSPHRAPSRGLTPPSGPLPGGWPRHTSCSLAGCLGAGARRRSGARGAELRAGFALRGAPFCAPSATERPHCDRRRLRSQAQVFVSFSLASRPGPCRAPSGCCERWLLARLLIWDKDCQLLVQIKNSAVAVLGLLPRIQKGHRPVTAKPSHFLGTQRRQLQHDDRATGYHGGRQAGSSRPKLTFLGHDNL